MELQLVNLTKEFGNFRAVNNLNLTISNGVYGLLGVNGAGKTTLMKMICSLLTPTSGKILCDGQDIGGMGGEYRNLLGYLPQEFGFYPEFTVKDFIHCSLKRDSPDCGKEKSKQTTCTGRTFQSC